MNNKPSSRSFSRGNTHSPHRASGSRQHRTAVTSSENGTHRAAKPAYHAAEVRQRRSRVLLGLYALLGIEIAIALLTSPALTIQSVRVRGLEDLPESERAQTLQALHINSATNLFCVPFRRLRQDANALAWVQNASIPHQFSRTVVANVTPRQPLFVLKVGMLWYETDAARVPIRIARNETYARLPHVIYRQECDVQPGIMLRDPALAGAIEILQALPSQNVVSRQEHSTRIAKIVIDQSDNICLNMQDGIEFKFGQSEDIAAKIALVKRIYAKDPGVGQMLASVNLSCPSAPACTPRVAQVSPPAAWPLMLPTSVTP